jgi:tetratricopeptide (TPR) repeat protein
VLIECIAPDARRYDEAKQLERHAQVHVLRLGDALERARLLDAVGLVELMAGHGEEALRRNTEAYAIWAAQAGAASHQVAVNLMRRGETLTALGRFDAAREAFERAHELFEAALGSWHPLVASALSRLGNIAHADGDLARAREDFERALKILEATGGKDSPGALLAINGLAVTWEGLGDLEKAAEYLERVLAVLDAAPGGQFNRGVVHENLGRTLAQLGRFAEGLAHQRTALDLRIEVLGEGHPLVSGPLHGIGECLVGLGRSEEAIEPLQRALQIRTEGGAGPHYLARTRFVLARALVTSDPARARALGEQAKADAAQLDASDPEAAPLQEAIAAWLTSK